MKFDVLCSSVSFIAMETFKTVFNEPTVLFFYDKEVPTITFYGCINSASVTGLLHYASVTLFLFFFLLHFDGPLVLLYFGEDTNTKSVTKVPFQ